jgi:hypothetical protein
MTIALVDLKTGNLKWQTVVDKAKSLLSFSLLFNGGNVTNIARVNGPTIYYLLFGKLYSFNREKEI